MLNKRNRNINQASRVIFLVVLWFLMIRFNYKLKIEDALIGKSLQVIYNRQTDQSRGFGFVTMSTVEEAEKAVEMFSRYVSCFLDDSLLFCAHILKYLVCCVLNHQNKLIENWFQRCIQVFSKL